MIKVSDTLEALKVVNGYLGVTAKDNKASERAGYAIYKNDKGEWFSDLGNRFEITTRTGTVNVWIDNDAELKEFVKKKIVTVYYKDESDLIHSCKYNNVSHYTVKVFEGQTCIVVWFNKRECASFPVSRLLSIQYES